MKDESKTKKQLIDELYSLRQRVGQLEKSETAQRQIPPELQMVQERFELLSSAIRDAIHDWDIRKNQLWCSVTMQKMFGVGEIMNDPWDWWISRVHPDERDRMTAVMDLFLKSDRVFGVNEYRIQRPDGNYAHILHRICVLRDDEGKPFRMLGVATDITLRKHMEDDLRLSEERYRIILDQAGDAVFIHDETGRLVEVNRKACQILGYSQEELLSKYIGDIDPDAILTRKGKLWSVILAGESQTFESRHIRKDGSIMPVEVTLGSVPLPRKKMIIGLVRDITGRKQVENELKRSEEKYRDLANFLPQIVFETDIKGIITFTNTMGLTMSGYEPADLEKGVHIFHVIIPEDRERARSNMQKIVAGETPKGNYYSFLRKDGSTFPVVIHSSPMIQDNQTVGLRGFAIDITEIQRTERELRESEERLKQSQEIAHLGSWELDLLQNRLLWSDEVYRIFGLQPQEFGATYEAFLDRIHPDERAFVDAAYRGSLRENHDSYEIEHRVIRKDTGEIRVVHEKCAHIRDGAGKIIRSVGMVHDITERKHTEEALFAQEIKLSSIFRAAPVGIGMVINRVFHEANDMLCEMTGYPREELLGQNARMLYPTQDDYDYVGQDKYRQINEKGTGTVETQWRKKDGMIIDIILSSTALDPHDLAKGVTFTALDITKRKQSEGALQESEERYRNIFENAVEGIYQSTPGGVFVNVNPAMAKMCGYETPAEMVSSITDIATQYYADPHDRDHFRRLLDEKGRIDNIEYRIRRKDGSIIWVSVSARAAANERGNILYYEGTVEDITNRKRAEEALQESEERFRALSENAPDIIYTMDLLGAITYTNPSWKKILGHDKEEILGRYFIEFAREEDKRSYKKLFKSIRDEEKTVNNYIGIILTKDGKERVFNMNSAFNRDSKGRILGVVGSMKDVTELRDIEKKLSQAEKMEAIGTLAGGIAHDFNNILAAILGYTQLAVDAPDEERRKRYLTQVLKSGERAKNLTSQILAFSRQDKQERGPIEVGGIVKEGMKLLRSLLPTTIEIRQDIESKPSITLSNAIHVHQILMNLCTNAAHAMRDKGGILHVRLDHIQLPAGELPTTVDLQPGSYIKLTVRDTGHGIDPGIIDRIFDPFFTTKKVDEGTGLGLAVAYGIVKSHGGSINVQSTPGKGSTFIVYLPMIEDTSEKKIEKPLPIPGGNERILFIDDEPYLADIGREGLRTLGYEVTVRTSSIEALEAFRARSERFDLVITDMTMPNMTGIQLADEILKVRPNTPIILCTGYSEMIDEEKAKKFGIRAFLMKPVSLDDVARTIRKVLDN